MERIAVQELDAVRNGAFEQRIRELPVHPVIHGLIDFLVVHGLIDFLVVHEPIELSSVRGPVVSRRVRKVFKPSEMIE